MLTPLLGTPKNVRVMQHFRPHVGPREGVTQHFRPVVGAEEGDGMR